MLFVGGKYLALLSLTGWLNLFRTDHLGFAWQNLSTKTDALSFDELKDSDQKEDIEKVISVISSGPHCRTKQMSNKVGWWANTKPQTVYIAKSEEQAAKRSAVSKAGPAWRSGVGEALCKCSSWAFLWWHRSRIESVRHTHLLLWAMLKNFAWTVVPKGLDPMWASAMTRLFAKDTQRHAGYKLRIGKDSTEKKAESFVGVSLALFDKLFIRSKLGTLQLI